MSLVALLTQTEAALSDPGVYQAHYLTLRKWIYDSMDEYRQELSRALYPLAAHAYLDLVRRGLAPAAAQLLAVVRNDSILSAVHRDDLINLASISTSSQLAEANDFVRQLTSTKYHIRMTRYLPPNFFIRYQQNNKMILLLRIINEHLRINVHADRPEALDDDMDQDEDPDLPPVKFANLPPDPWLTRELESALKDNAFAHQDIQQMNDTIKKMKQEPSADSPSRTDVPLPPPKMIDIVNEIRVLQELRMKMVQKPASCPTICSYTLHNTYDGLSCARLSPDISLMSAGLGDNSVRIWNVKGNATSMAAGAPTIPCNPATPIKLVGHSDTVHATSFSPDNKYIVSGSSDTSLRLWSLETKECVAVYRGHNYPVWDCEVGPFGVYFCSAGYDRTARLWSADHIFPLRVFSGHLSDVDVVRFHPNNNYILTGSTDKTARLWDVQRASCVRLFKGHASSPVTSLAFSSDGKMAATGSDDGICVWDIGSGKLFTRFASTGGVNSLTFSSDASVVVAAGRDGRVCLWDIEASAASEEGNGKELLHTFYTKKTSLHQVAYSRAGVLFTLGGFNP